MSVHFKTKSDADNFTPPSYAVREISNEEYFSFINLSKVTFEDIEKKENFQRFYPKTNIQVVKY